MSVERSIRASHLIPYETDLVQILKNLDSSRKGSPRVNHPYFTRATVLSCPPKHVHVTSLDSFVNGEFGPLAIVGPGPHQNIQISE